MKVLKNNFKYIYEKPKLVKKYPREFTCEYCQSEFEYEESDMTIGWLGAAHIKCPCCGRDIMLDDEDGITLTVDNVEFPTHFHHTSTETGAVDICNNKEIKKYIHNAIDYFRKNKDEFAWTSSSGNLAIHVYRYSDDEDYHVVVNNDYYETNIPFEEEDYE